MSLKIIKPGILDTIQDLGRHGYQHRGIQVNGAMDCFAAGLSNALLGKDLTSPVLEMHFPAPVVLFEQETIICLTGADFTAVINGNELPLHQPVAVNKNSLLQFKKIRYGARCYLSVLADVKINGWLGSYSTNVKIGAGGFKGRALQKGDVLFYESVHPVASLLNGKEVVFLHWKAGLEKKSFDIACIPGAEWDCLIEEAKSIFQNHPFRISDKADRMGYRIKGELLIAREDKQLVSSAVSFGTIQLLPSRQMIILMADHQTTGGYPRIAHVISAHLPALAQMKPNDELTFRFVSVQEAEFECVSQQKYLQTLQHACRFRMENLWL